MLVRFSSTATESITMFGESAVQLIRMLGATGAVPGAIGADDIPKALQRLRAALEQYTDAEQDEAEAASENDDKEHRPSVALATRAVPLIDVLARSSAANAPVMWEKL